MMRDAATPANIKRADKSVRVLRMKAFLSRALVMATLCHVLSGQAGAQQIQSLAAAGAVGTSPVASSLAPKFVIGVGDVLGVTFWREQAMSGDVVVRPDGKISLPLLNDVQAAGYTPEQLAAIVGKAAAKYVADPLASVIVRQINSRKVFVLGAVGKQGPVVLTSDMTVLQLIALVGGLQEYADKKGIVVVRQENGREKRMKFNYNEVIEGKKLEQNIMLKPGDTVLVFD